MVLSTRVSGITAFELDFSRDWNHETGVDLGYILQLDAEEADDNKTNISDPQLGQCSTGQCGDSETGVLPDISDPQLGQCSTGQRGDNETDWCIA